MKVGEPNLTYHVKPWLLRPEVVLAHFSPSKWGLRIPRRTIAEFELVYALDGEGTFSILEMNFPIGEGDVILTPPWIWHGYDTGRKPFPHYAIHFSLFPGYEQSFERNAFVKRSDGRLKIILGGRNAIPLVMKNLPASFRHRFHTVIRRKEDVDLGQPRTARMRLRAAFLELISDLCDFLLDVPGDETRSLAASLRHIDKHFTRILTVPELAAIEGLSPNYYSSIFKKIRGVGPVEHINRKRLALAKKMIRETNVKLAYVATQCGFDDPYYFSKIFKRYEGRSPREYRKATLS